VPEQGRLEYAEGLLIGYRGYDQAGRVPRFAFGHGLGYTTWDYLSVAAESAAVGPDSDLALTVRIRNTGSRPGREVVQAYVEPESAEDGRPVRALAAFAAASAEPGQTASVRFTVPARAFARYDETARAWVWPAGEFAVRIGRSSADLRLSVRVKSLFFRTNRRSPGRERLMLCRWRSLSGMRARAAAACAAAGVIIGCAGCTSGPAHPQLRQAHATATATATAPAPLTLPDRALPSPGCSTATATSPSLSGVRTAMVSVPGNPFGVAVTPDGRWAFVAVGASIEVLRTGLPLAPAEVATIPVPGGPLGVTLTRDGRYLLAASGSGAVVLSVARAEQGRADAVLGTLNDPQNEPAGPSGAIEVTVSADGDYAFVTQEDNYQAAVFNLHRALTQGFGSGDFVGTIPLGLAPVGLAVSPDGRWLYATSEVSRQGNPQSEKGTLTVISVARAETDPAASVAATVPAGCNPVRVITSADGREVWVTARASDDLLCFSAAALQADPSRALVAIVRVGEAPVGLMLVRNGSLVVVADSNRFGAAGATSDLSVVNVAAAVAGKPAVTGVIPAGGFPREMALEPDGQRLLVSNYMSGQLEAISIPSIP
jgi:DNA-binding beta-propeller fold protein YncE